MRRLLLSMIVLMMMLSLGLGQDLKPYILGAISAESMDMVKQKTQANLDSAGFTLLGEYAPAGDTERWVFVVTSDEMTRAVKSTGGLTGFAAAVRVALTAENGQVNISYTNPIYLGNAYFQKEYPEVASNWIAVHEKLNTSMENLGEYKNTPFGVEEGFKPKEVRGYHYMFGMEYFDDVVELNEFSSFAAGKQTIESELARGGNTNLVYSYEIPGTELKLYGIGLSGPKGEGHFLPIIDISTPKHTAFLPYEILLMGDTAVMMHGRYRIALAFPDLTMTTFGKIMSTPGNIEDLMRSVTE